ncbi:MAG: HWE histidine kinase domain-containing protein [Hyphomicrobiales bacterium]
MDQRTHSKKTHRPGSGFDLVDAVERLADAKAFDEIITVVRDAAHSMSGADGVTLIVREGDCCHYLEEKSIAPLWKGRRFPMHACVSGWCMTNRQSAVVPDIYADERIPHDVYRPTYVKSLVVVPVGTANPVGAIGAYWAKRKMPRPSTVRNLELLARAAATALVSASRQEALGNRIDELGVLYAFTDRLYRAETSSEIYEAALDAITGALRCERASILAFDEFGVMRFVAARGLSMDYCKAVEGHSPWRLGEREPQPIFVRDIAETTESAEIKATISGEGICSLAFIPLMANGGVIGKFMAYHCQPHEFGPHERNIAITIARQLGFSMARMSVEAARLRAEALLRESEQRLDFALRAGRMGAFEWNALTGKVYWSPSLEAIHGLREGAFGGTVDAAKADIHPDDLDHVLAEVDRSLKTGVDYHVLYRMLHPCGEQRWLEAFGSPVVGNSGVVEKLGGVCIDITDRKRVEEALGSANETSRQLVERSPFGIYVVNADFRMVQVSAGAQKAFENVKPLIGRDFAEVLRTIWIEPFATEAIDRFRHTLTTGEPYHSTHTVEPRRDIEEVQSYDWRIERLTLSDGRPGVVCHFYDLTERQRHEEHVQLLLNEVNHRSKNLLAVIQAIANQTARTLEAQEFAQQFTQRLRAIAASQDLVTKGNWTDVGLADLVQSQLAHLRSFAERISIEGPNIRIAPFAAQAIGLALHELSTNALKHGALSNEAGRVRIAWSLEGPSETRALRIAWTERQGPLVKEPTRRGFGRTVLEKMAALALTAEVELRFVPEGISWQAFVPEQALVKHHPNAEISPEGLHVTT